MFSSKSLFYFAAVVALLNLVWAIGAVMLGAGDMALGYLLAASALVIGLAKVSQGFSQQEWESITPWTARVSDKEYV